MAIISLDKQKIKKIIGNRSDENLDNYLSLFGSGVEKITDSEIEVEIAPNRPDMLSVPGYLRALRAYSGKKTGLRKYKVRKSGYKLTADKSLPDEWPYVYACIVKGLKFDDDKIKEVIEIQEKLDSTLMRLRKKGGIGIYPLEKITFPVRFIGMKPSDIKFRPLEYPVEITGRQILSRHPTGRKYAHICRNWKKFPVFVDKKGVIMSMPPIINSHDVGKIDKTTKNVFIEVTGSRDKETLKKSLIIIATALAEMGGTIYSLECRQKNGKKESFPDLSPDKIKLNPENVKSLLGIKLSKREVKKLLEKMGYGFDIKKKAVLIPSWRADILHEVDIIEDIAIAYGYDKFKPEVPQISTIGEESKRGILKKKISEALVGLSFLETSTYHLLRRNDLKKLNPPYKNYIELEKSKTDYSYLRADLICPALKVFSDNLDAEYPQKIFETGVVFERDKEGKSKTGIKENERLVAAISPGNFTEMKQILDYLGNLFERKFSLKSWDMDPRFISGRCAEVLYDNRKVGIIGEIHPNILRNWHLKMPIALFEVDVDIFG